MAMLREVEHEEEEGQALTRVTDTVVNERTGLVTQQRTVAYQIRREDGGTAIVIGRSVHAARVPGWIQTNVRQQRRQTIQNRRGSDNHQPDRNNDRIGLLIFKACCSLFFLPCIINDLLLLTLQCLALGSAITGIVFIALGPLHDCGAVFSLGSITTILLLLIVLLMSIVCVCVACTGDERCNACRTGLFFIACFLGMSFLFLLAINSAIVFNHIPSVVHGNCHYSQTLLAVVCYSYGLVIFFCCCWIACYSIVKNMD